jgi:predicted nucleic acid-binding protein
MSGLDPTPLFVDTGPFYARFDENDAHHEHATSIFRDIRNGTLLYRPVYTSRYVLAEATRLLVQRVGHDAATTALRAIRGSDLFRVLEVDDDRFDRACDQFEQYDDHTISLVDHLSGVLAESRDTAHVFTFDPDDFETIGLTPIPRALGVDG